MTKRLYKIENGKKLCGVCGGIAEYFNIDATIVRLLWVFLILLGFIDYKNLILYIIYELQMCNLFNRIFVYSIII